MGTPLNNDTMPLEAAQWYAWEPDETESNWLLTYVDMLSVVLAMLVVLLGQMAAQQLQTPVPGDSPVAVEQPSLSAPPPTATPVAEPLSTTSSQPAVPLSPTPEAQLAAAIETQFQGEIRVVRKDQGISLEIAEVILFDSAKADLLKAAEPVLARLVRTLQAIGEADVAVEGHTDDQPILGGRFHSNWELAAARANAVTRYLLSQGFDPQRLRSVSYADTHPVADNSTLAGRAANRRVNLRVEFL